MNKRSPNRIVSIQFFLVSKALVLPLLLSLLLFGALNSHTNAAEFLQAPEFSKQITGQVTWADGTAAEGIRVAAKDLSVGWYPAYSDPNGYYTLTLPAGNWQLEIDTIVQYDLEQGNFDEQSAQAVLIRHSRWYSADLPHTIEFAADDSTETHTFDLGLQRTNSVITGTLRSLDGTPLTGIQPNTIYVNAYSEQYDKDDSYSYINLATGVYTVSVASGSWELTYGLKEDPNSIDPFEAGTAAPVSVTIEANSVTQQDLIIEEYDATISGLILRTDTGDPVLGGSVSFTNGNKNRYAEVVEDGRFRLAVRSGTTWDVEASWAQNFGTVIYPTGWEGVVVVPNAGVTELTIGGVIELNEAAFLPFMLGQ